MRRSFGFTLIELLIVIGIIAVLLAILLPALGVARERGRRTACGANLYAIGRGASAYASEFGDNLPMLSNSPALGINFISIFAANQIMNSRVSGALKPGPSQRIFFCPSNPTLGDSPYWHNGVSAPDEGGPITIGYRYMGQNAAYDLTSNPTASKPYGINAASNLAGTARRVPPLHYFARMHDTPLPGRCDFILDAIMSTVRSADPNATKTSTLNGNPFYPPNGNFTYIFLGFPTWGGTLTGSTSHLNKSLPAGANVLSLDGHVEWRAWNADTSFIAGDGPPLPGLGSNKCWTGAGPFFWYPAPP